MQLKLYNTLTRKKEVFEPLRKDRIGLYTCGPTVYNYAHIGNLRTYIFEDVLRRALTRAGYRVRHVMNITDVGHLTSDADTGEDKLEKGATREGKTVWDIARFYTDAFLRDIALLNIRRADKLIPATATIKDQIALIKKLFAKGYAYETEQAVYFDVSKFKNYTALSGQKLADKMTGARDGVVTDPEKRHPQDFVLWFKRVGKFADHTMHWPSPWGDGFPGWHIECSAISAKYLGQPFDIHTGGVDHISVHHTNEIAQTEGATGKPLARVWMHGEFLLVDTAKMAKSAGNFFTLATLTEKGCDPLSLRYLTLTTHYRTKLNFTWESLDAAAQSLARLRTFAAELRKVKKSAVPEDASLKKWSDAFNAAISDDLNTPKALALVWEIISAYRRSPERCDAKKVLALLYHFDRVLGLGLRETKAEKIPKKILALVEKREILRKQKDWQGADRIRHEIARLGWRVEDTSDKPLLKYVRGS